MGARDEEDRERRCAKVAVQCDAVSKRVGRGQIEQPVAVEEDDGYGVQACESQRGRNRPAQLLVNARLHRCIVHAFMIQHVRLDADERQDRSRTISRIT